MRAPAPQPVNEQDATHMGASTGAGLAALTAAKQTSTRLPYGVPIIVFAALAAMLSWALNRDPRTIPSALIGRHVPQFALAPVKGHVLGLSSDDLTGEVSLVNVFASWCVECRVEHPLLLRIKADGIVPIHGLNYKDAPDDAARWLNGFGDPYTRTGADLNGRVGIDWGVYGVPETFVITKEGRIAYKQIGPIDSENWRDAILPLIRELRQQ